MPLIDELTSGPAPKQSVMDKLTPLSTGTPIEEFLLAVMNMADGKGLLDSAFQPSAEPSVEEQVDDVGGLDNLDSVSREDMTILVDKFTAMPPEHQKLVMDGLAEENPRMAEQALAAIRLIKGRDGNK